MNHNDLIKKYPKIFRDAHCDPKISCLAFGLEIGNGWIPLIDQLCHQLQWDTDANGYPQVIADQVKEKYGALRFYAHEEGGDLSRHEYEFKRYSRWQKFVVRSIKFLFPWLRHKFEYNFAREIGEIDGAIKFAEHMSYKICENCGEPGVCNRSGWLAVRCRKCRPDED